ncbi:MAG TPA: FAD-binding protein [Pseudonocardiaceae bacterium]
MRPRGSATRFTAAQVHGGIVIDMGRLRTVHRVQDDRVVVAAGATWSEVLAATLPRGLTPPVLTNRLVPAPRQVRRFVLSYPT